MHFITTKNNAEKTTYLFNAFYYKKLLNLNDKMTDAQLYKHWLKHSKKECIVPIDTQIFDSTYYLNANPDVDKDGGWCFEHYHRFGVKEGRYPNQLFTGERFKAFYVYYLPEAKSLNEFFFCTDELREIYIRFVDKTDFEYKKILKLLYHIGGLSFTKEELIEYLKAGHFDLPLFDEMYYSENAKKLLPSSEKYDLLHWLILGRMYNLSFMYIFNDTEYLEVYPTLKNYSKGAFHHYIFYGIQENRNPNKLFNAQYYQKRYSPSLPAITDYYLNNPKATFSLQVIPEIIQCAIRKNILEEVYYVTKNTKEHLESSILKEQLHKLSLINPDILRQSDKREIKIPFISHPDNLFYAIHRQIENILSSQAIYKNIDTVIFIPHCRTSGAARVAGSLAIALNALSFKTIVITTELDIIEKPEWFPKSQLFFDLSSYANQLNHDQKMRLMVGLLRGMNIHNIYNVNSKLAWETFNYFGKQLSVTRNLYSYLFCWDRDMDGYKSGYPREYFASTYPYIKGFLLDSQFLKDDLTKMYYLSKKLQEKLHVCYSPIENQNIELNIAELAQLKSSLSSRKKVFWAGRFDRQKRFDILIEVSKKMPQIDFFVWGKKVLNDFDFDQSALPANITVNGEYQDITELPLISCDAWLYTSQWDGIPTILLDIGKYGIPIVSTAVDGLKDIITEKTAWPVYEVENIDMYVDNLILALETSSNIIERTKSMIKLIKTRHNEELYKKSIEELHT